MLNEIDIVDLSKCSYWTILLSPQKPDRIQSNSNLIFAWLTGLNNDIIWNLQLRKTTRNLEIIGKIEVAFLHFLQNSAVILNMTIINCWSLLTLVTSIVYVEFFIPWCFYAVAGSIVWICTRFGKLYRSNNPNKMRKINMNSITLQVHIHSASEAESIFLIRIAEIVWLIWGLVAFSLMPFQSFSSSNM